jgi:hypothetical protein
MVLGIRVSFHFLPVRRSYHADCCFHTASTRRYRGKLSSSPWRNPSRSGSSFSASFGHLLEFAPAALSTAAQGSWPLACVMQSPRVSLGGEHGREASCPLFLLVSGSLKQKPRTARPPYGFVLAHLFPPHFTTPSGTDES